MDLWDQTVESYPFSPDARCFSKALKTAEVVLKQDLAEFESEWITNTLFYKPVNLFETVTSNCSDTQWQKPVCDAFKLIVMLLENYQVEHLHENIVILCLLPYPATVRKSALECVGALARSPAAPAPHLATFVSELQDAVTCRAPLAALVGTIAEHHPEIVADDVHTIWRVYLNLLESNKNSDTVISAILQGILGIFKHFGQDLPLVELRELYARISKEYIGKSKCEEACLLIVGQYANLFKEILAEDALLRRKLWNSGHSQKHTTLIQIYKAFSADVAKDKLQKISDSELAPRINTRDNELKYTALRIMRHLIVTYGITGQVEGHAEVELLEYELKSGSVSYESADAILWCIESNSLYSDKLLQSAILFYTNIPTSKRRNIVVYGLLNSPDDVRTTATIFLINESCQPSQDSPHNIDKYLPLWEDLFDTKGGRDNVVLEKGRKVITDYMEYLFSVIEGALEEFEILSEKLTPLLTLTYNILNIHPVDDYTKDVCSDLMQLLLQCCRYSATAIALATAVQASLHCGMSLTEFCKIIRIDKCVDESVLCEACHVLVRENNCHGDVSNVLLALEILFTRKNVEPSILTLALKTFESILEDIFLDLDQNRVDYIIYLVDQLKYEKNSSNKEARIFHRNIFIFLGKYGNNNVVVPESYKENIVKLKDKLLLNIPNTEYGITYKVNLQRLLHLAVMYEDPDVLQKFLAILCVRSSPTPLPLVCRALSRSHATGNALDLSTLVYAVSLCRTVEGCSALLTYISEEVPPGARKMLSDTLEGILLTEPGSEQTANLVRTVAEEAQYMMKSNLATTRSGGLNITDTLLTALKDNHSLQKTILPDLIPLILETNGYDAKTTFDAATEVFLENFEIYQTDIVNIVSEKLMNNIIANDKLLDSDDDVKLFKDKVKVTVSFIKDVKYTNIEQKCLENLDTNLAKVLYVVAEAKLTIQDGFMKDILGKIVDLEWKDNDEILFEVEAVLKFLEVFIEDVLLKNKEMTIQALEKVLTNISPAYIIKTQKQLKSCLNPYTRRLKHKYFINFFQNWYRKFEIDNFIKKILSRWFFDEHLTFLTSIKSLNFYTELLNITYVFDENILSLTDLILDIYANKDEKYLDGHKAYLSEVLTVSLKLKSLTDIKKIISISYEKTQLRFLKYFIAVFCKYLLLKPFVLSDDGLKEVNLILNDVLKFILKKREEDEVYVKILELIEMIWPIYDQVTTFGDKLATLRLISRLPIQLHPSSKPVRWAVENALTGNRIEDKIRLVTVLPGGEGCGAAYRSLASQLPIRVSELSGSQHAALRAILDAAATNADSEAIDVITKIAACDQTQGWWNDAMASTFATLGRRGDCRFKLVRIEADDEGNSAAVVEERSFELITVANMLFEHSSVGVANRLLLPLLRYSTAEFCEEFYSNVINKLLSNLNTWPQPSADHHGTARVLAEHARSMGIITAGIEKIPLSSLKSEDSRLYTKVSKKQPSLLMKKTSAYCMALRSKTLPSDASDELRRCHRESLIENFKCFSTAVCVSRPAEKFYDLLFDVSEWKKLVDCEQHFQLPLKNQWQSQRSTFHTTSLEVATDSTDVGSVRTRVFLRTLSEEPWRFDLMAIPVQEKTPTQLELVANELNSHELCVTLTALVKHAVLLTHSKWVTSLVDALVGDSHRNVKWIVAQVVCNCKEELKSHAASLRPALLAMVADTACDQLGKRTLNCLHVDALEVILSWQPLETTQQTTDKHLMSTIEYLINTTIDNDHRPSVFNSLLSLIKRLIVMYGVKELIWTGFQDLLAAQDKLKSLLRVLLTIVQQKVNIPTLLTTLSMLEDKYWGQEIKLAELFGHSLANESERGDALARYRRFLARKRQTDVEYVKLLYYTQKGYPNIVDESGFKIITSLTPKMVAYYKKWCLGIIATYLENVQQTTEYITSMFETIDIVSLVEDNPLEALPVVKHGVARMGDRMKRAVMKAVTACCNSPDGKVRSAAGEVAVKVFEDIFASNDIQPLPKRFKTSLSIILTTMQSLDNSTVIECLARGDYCRERVAASLSGDGSDRLAESFLLAITVPATLKTVDLSTCVTTFLELLLHRIRSQPRFLEMKLRDEPLDISNNPLSVPSRLLTNSKSYHGTILTYSRKRTQKTKTASFGTSATGLNVQIPLDEILSSLIEFCKSKPAVAQALCVQITKAFLTPSNPAFESLQKQILDILSLPSDVVPLAIEIGRILVDQTSDVSGFQNTVEKLLRYTRGTDGEPLAMLLHEDVIMRLNTRFEVLGTINCEEVNMEVDNTTSSSLEELIAIFGKLSNWDDLTIQEKSEVMNSGLPDLWVDDYTFRGWVDRYEVLNTKSWFDKMIVCYRDRCKRNSLRWLRETDRWPTRRFDISVMAEIIQNFGETDDEVAFWDIKPTDCLAEWAARLMLRRAYPSEEDSDSVTTPQYIEELRWCRKANDRQLPHLALNCIRVHDRHILPWKIEKARALRTMGLCNTNIEVLKTSLSLMESTEVHRNSSVGDVITMKNLILNLHNDLGSLTKDKIRDILTSINQKTENQNVSKENKQTLFSLYETALTHYDDVWAKDSSPKSELISNMADIVGLVIKLDLKHKSEMFLSVILNRLGEVNLLGNDAASNVLDKINQIIEYLDEFSLASIQSHRNRFPASLMDDYSHINRALQVQDSVDSYKMRFKLVCDPRYSLLQRCMKLIDCKDPSTWKKLFDLLKENIFENPYALESTEYQILTPYKRELYEIANYAETESTKRTKILRQVIESLMSKVTDRTTLLLSQLCPALTREPSDKSERDRCLSRLLKLRGLNVIKFYEELSVFTNAITRPVVMKVLLSDGSTRKFITKSGDPLLMDCAAQRVARSAVAVWGKECFLGYTVTPLGEDSGLIEYLEDTITFRALICSVQDLDEINKKMEKFIVSSSPMEKFKTYSSQIPGHTLRSAIENNCLSTEDFIKKKNRFTETISSAAILGSIFGLGDRHLENLLYDLSSGSAGGVDWGNAGAWGRGELPPCRLGGVVAKMGGNALEVHLQKLFSSLRDSRKLFLNVVKLSFEWMGEDFNTMFRYMELFLSGRATLHEITEMSLSTAENAADYKEALRALREVFGSDSKQNYTVAEQISGLLRQSTDPRILCITRPGWEPWV